MQPVDYIALAIPVFFALIGVEVVVAHLQGARLYRLNDSLNDISTGIVDQVLGIFTKAATVGAYALVWDHWRLASLDATAPWVWVICFLGVDFFYYWFHRVSHEVNLPWGAHIVHHQSEEFNLSVALRQGAFQPLFSFPFYLPLALAGFPPILFLACSSFDTLYQFWIHTRTIDKLGPLEWVLNTPSHHRVHHGCDDAYIDKNYAGTLIVWDRLFGTFEPERAAPTYGVTKPLRTWNPLWANLDHYARLLRASARAPSLAAAAQLWWKPPGFAPDWAKAAEPTPTPPSPLTHGEAGKYDANPPSGLVAYVLIHYLVVLGITVFLLFNAHDLTRAWRIGLALFVAWSVANIGGLFDRRRWVVPAEVARLLVLGCLAAAVTSMASSGPLRTAGLVTSGALVAGFGAWLLAQRPSLRLTATLTAP
jgi:sterol desaturase/sphingolipid hydroxylase (fatty acid hydroxylase superfamily)